MILFKKAADISSYLQQVIKSGRSIGFVPTMGALHQGHISLMGISKKANAVSVCSIFVNPTQFNDAKDFDNYPSTIEKDIDALEKAGCDMLFLPSVSEIYPTGTQNAQTYDLGYFSKSLASLNWVGFTKILQMVSALAFFEMPINEICPWCNAPIVGTKPILLPNLLVCSR